MEILIENDVLDRIQALMKFRHWTIYRLAKESGMPYSSLNNIFKRKTCPSIPTLEKICRGLNISMSIFFEYKSNPLRNNELTDTEQDLLNMYRSMSKSDKTLMETYAYGLCKR